MGALLRRAGADDLVVGDVVAQDPHGFLGDALVLVGHVGVGPHDDLAARLLGADAARRAGAAVAAEGQDPKVRVALLRVAQDVKGVVGARVVDAEQFVGVLAGDHRRGDAVDLLQDVRALVVAGQHDRDVRRRAGAVGAVLDRVGRVTRAGAGGCVGARLAGLAGLARLARRPRRVVAAAGHLPGPHRDLLRGRGVEDVVVIGARGRGIGVLVHHP